MTYLVQFPFAVKPASPEATAAVARAAAAGFSVRSVLHGHAPELVTGYVFAKAVA